MSLLLLFGGAGTAAEHVLIGAFTNLSPRVRFANISPGVEFDNLSPRVTLEKQEASD
jgi:hypothetical protein